jgi:hypothetical protein
MNPENQTLLEMMTSQFDIEKIAADADTDLAFNFICENGIYEFYKKTLNTYVSDRSKLLENVMSDDIENDDEIGFIAHLEQMTRDAEITFKTRVLGWWWNEAFGFKRSKEVFLNQNDTHSYLVGALLQIDSFTKEMINLQAILEEIDFLEADALIDIEVPLVGNPDVKFLASSIQGCDPGFYIHLINRSGFVKLSHTVETFDDIRTEVKQSIALLNRLNTAAQEIMSVYYDIDYYDRSAIQEIKAKRYAQDKKQNLMVDLLKSLKAALGGEVEQVGSDIVDGLSDDLPDAIQKLIDSKKSEGNDVKVAAFMHTPKQKGFAFIS